MPDGIDWTDRMTGRARGYLTIAGVRHLLIGTVCLFYSDLFISPAFTQIKAVLPIPVWGLAFIAAAVICLTSAIRGTGSLARLGLIASAITTAVWAGGFVAAAIVDLRAGRQPSGPTGVIIYIAVAAKDLVVCRNPMRSPFEDLAQRIVDAEDQ